VVRKWAFMMAISIGAVTVLELQGVPAQATANGHAGTKSALVGELGYEGGPAPGRFHPTSGTVLVQFTSVPLTLEKHVGAKGHFRIPLGPGKYTVTGCGPSSGGGQPLCSQPVNVTLAAGEIYKIQLVWAYAP